MPHDIPPVPNLKRRATPEKRTFRPRQTKGIGLAATTLLILSVGVAQPTSAQVPGATYQGTTSIGGTVGLEVSADGNTVTSFSVFIGLGGDCGGFDTFGYGDNPIVDQSFAYDDEFDPFRYSGTFSEQTVEGVMSYDDPFDSSCSFDITWTAAVVHTLTVILSGSGVGDVESSPDGIYCGEYGTTCSEQFSGSVALTATPNFGAYFEGWSGDCSGTGDCTVQMDGDRSVTATFNDWTLKITKHPKKKTKSRKATFAFTSSAPGSTFKCSISGQLKRCTSPKTYKNLIPGPQQFQVQAKDQAGNLGPSEYFDWTIKGRH